MRLLRTALSLLLIWSNCWSLASAQVAGKRAELQLTTSIIEQKYCDSNQLRMTLQLNYTNGGTRPLILYKYSTAVFHTLVSLNTEDAAAKKYAQEMYYTVNLVGDLEQPEASAPGDEFVILQPHQSYTIKARVIIFLYDGHSTSLRNLRAGEYFLQVDVRTWYEEEKTAKRLNKRWRPVGFLWTDDVRSLPMPFEVKQQHQTINCSQLTQ